MVDPDVGGPAVFDRIPKVELQCHVEGLDPTDQASLVRWLRYLIDRLPATT